MIKTPGEYAARLRSAVRPFEVWNAVHSPGEEAHDELRAVGRLVAEYLESLEEEDGDADV